MSEHDWRRVKEIFGEALDLPAEERARFLDAACAGNAEVRARVDGLLGSYSAAGEFLAAPSHGIPPTAPLDDDAKRKALEQAARWKAKLEALPPAPDRSGK